MEKVSNLSTIKRVNLRHVTISRTFEVPASSGVALKQTTPSVSMTQKDLLAIIKEVLAPWQTDQPKWDQAP